MADQPRYGYSNIDEAIRHHLEFENLRVRAASLSDLAGAFEVPEAFDVRLTNCAPEGARLNDRSVLFMGRGCRVRGTYAGGRRALVYLRHVDEMTDVTFADFKDSRIVIMNVTPPPDKPIKNLTFRNLERTTVEILNFGPWINESEPLITDCRDSQFNFVNLAEFRADPVHLFQNLERCHLDWRNVGFVTTRESIFYRCRDCVAAVEFGLVGNPVDWITKEVAGGRWWFRIQEAAPRHGYMANDVTLEFDQCDDLQLGGKGFVLVNARLLFDRCRNVGGDLLFLMCQGVRCVGRRSKFRSSTATWLQCQDLHFDLDEFEVQADNVVGQQVQRSAFTFKRSKITTPQTVWQELSDVRLRQEDTKVEAGVSLITNSVNVELRYERVQEQAGATAYEAINGLSHKWRAYQLQAGADGVKAQNVRGFWEGVQLQTGGVGVDAQNVTRWFMYDSQLETGADSFKAEGGDGYVNFARTTFQKEFTLQQAQYVRLRGNHFQKPVRLQDIQELRTWRNTYVDTYALETAVEFETREDQYQKETTVQNVRRLRWLSSATQQKLTLATIEKLLVQHASWRDVQGTDWGDVLLTHFAVEAPEEFTLDKAHRLKTEQWQVTAPRFTVSNVASWHASWCTVRATDRTVLSQVAADQWRQVEWQTPYLTWTGGRAHVLDSTFRVDQSAAFTDVEMTWKHGRLSTTDLGLASCQGEWHQVEVQAQNAVGLSNVLLRVNEGTWQGASLHVEGSRFTARALQGTFRTITLRGNAQVEWRVCTWRGDLESQMNFLALVGSQLQGAQATFAQDALHVTQSDLDYARVTVSDMRDVRGRKLTLTQDLTLIGSASVDLAEVQVNGSVRVTDGSGRLAHVVVARGLTLEDSGKLNLAHVTVGQDLVLRNLDEGRLLAVDVQGSQARLAACRNVLWQQGTVGGTLTLDQCKDVGVADVAVAASVVVTDVTAARCGLVTTPTLTVTRTTGFFTAANVSGTASFQDCPAVSLLGGTVNELTVQGGSVAVENLTVNQARFTSLAGLRTFAVRAASWSVQDTVFWIGFGDRLDDASVENVGVELCGAQVQSLSAQSAGLNLVSVTGSSLSLKDCGALLTRGSFGSASLESSGLMLVQGDVGSINCDAQSAVQSVSGNASIQLPFRTFTASRGRALMAAGGKLGLGGAGVEGFLQGPWFLDVQGDVTFTASDAFNIESSGGAWVGGCVQIPELDADSC